MIEKKLEVDCKDVIQAVVKAGIATYLPITGPFAAELLNFVINPSLEKRRDKFLDSVAERLKVLEGKIEGFSIEKLSQDEVFITTIFQSTQIALRNHHEEKLVALRNAVLNTALKQTPEENMQMIFLRFIDELTPLHLRILKFLNDPSEPIKLHSKSFTMLNTSSVIFPEMDISENVLDLLMKELHAKNLTTTSSLQPVILRDPLTPKNAKWGAGSEITKSGKDFLAYISSP